MEVVLIEQCHCAQKIFGIGDKNKKRLGKRAVIRIRNRLFDTVNGAGLGHPKDRILIHLIKQAAKTFLTQIHVQNMRLVFHHECQDLQEYIKTILNRIGVKKL